MAARENNCERIESLHNNHWVDSIKGRKEHRTKVMVCEFVWRRNVGHVGNKLRLWSARAPPHYGAERE